MKTLKQKIGMLGFNPVWLYLASLVSGIVVAIILLQTDQNIGQIIELSFLTSLLLIIGLIDFKTKTIPNELIVIGLVFKTLMYVYYFIFTTINMFPMILNQFMAAFICGIIFFIGRLFNMGAGDIKLFFMLGLFLGLNDSFNMLFYTILVMFIFSIVALITKKMNIKDEIAVGPFAFFGFLVMIIIGL